MPITVTGALDTVTKRATFVIAVTTDDPDEISDIRSSGRTLVDIVSERDREGIFAEYVERGLQIVIDGKRPAAKRMIRDLTSMLDRFRLSRS